MQLVPAPGVGCSWHETSLDRHPSAWAPGLAGKLHLLTGCKAEGCDPVGEGRNTAACWGEAGRTYWHCGVLTRME